jgi:cytochrome c oxidase subunit II
MRRYLDEIILGVGVAIALIISYWLGSQAYEWMPSAATQEAERVDNLFSFLVSIGAFIFLGVAGMIGWALLTCRAKTGDFSEGHPARDNTPLELIWTIVPTVLVLWIAIQSQNIYQLLNLEGLHMLAPSPTKEIALSKSKPDPQETIGVSVKQWAWTFRYPGKVVSNELHLPVNRVTWLVMESEDVLHGFYVPEFRIKQDIVPNLKITFSLTPRLEGHYRLQDSQFSGTYFALMKADVYVESVEKFRHWLAATSQLEPILADNPATIEHTNPTPKLGSHWPSIAPNAPAIINAKRPTRSNVVANSEPNSRDRT